LLNISYQLQSNSYTVLSCFAIYGLCLCNYLKTFSGHVSAHGSNEVMKECVLLCCRAAVDY